MFNLKVKLWELYFFCTCFLTPELRNVIIWRMFANRLRTLNFSQIVDVHDHHFPRSNSQDCHVSAIAPKSSKLENVLFVMSLWVDERDCPQTLAKSVILFTFILKVEDLELQCFCYNFKTVWSRTIICYLHAYVDKRPFVVKYLSDYHSWPFILRQNFPNVCVFTI